MHTPVLLPAAGLGVYWLVDVFVEERMVEVVKDEVEEGMGEVEEEVIGMGLPMPMPGSVV